jgi:hypothetical protein
MRWRSSTTLLLLLAATLLAGAVALRLRGRLPEPGQPPAARDAAPAAAAPGSPSAGAAEPAPD